MTYCDGNLKTLKHRKESGSTELTETLLSSPYIEFNRITMLKPVPKRKLTLEQQFLVFLIKLRLGIMVEDLTFHFKVLPGEMSETFIT